MSRPCTICSSPSRKKVDAALVAGQTAASVARRYKLGVDSVRRHKRRDLSPALVKVVRRENSEESASDALRSVHERLEQLYERIDRFVDAAEDAALRRWHAALARKPHDPRGHREVDG